MALSDRLPNSTCLEGRVYLADVSSRSAKWAPQQIITPGTRLLSILRKRDFCFRKWNTFESLEMWRLHSCLIAQFVCGIPAWISIKPDWATSVNIHRVLQKSTLNLRSILLNTVFTQVYAHLFQPNTAFKIGLSIRLDGALDSSTNSNPPFNSNIQLYRFLRNNV